MTEHLTFEVLCDVHDAVVDDTTAASARAHLARCASCSEQMASIALLANETAALPRAIAPPEDLWNDIKAELAPRVGVPVGRARNWSRGQLVAAAAIIALSSSALTMTMMRRSQATSQRTAAAVPRSRVDVMPAAILPASLASEESGFTRSIDVLQRTLDERRDSLAPSTVETVERSLRVADSAIVEARNALARDPANRALAKLFASNYERKIDLLRRATELAPRT